MMTISEFNTVDISQLRNMMVLAWDISVWFVCVIHFHFLFFDTHFLFLKSCTHFMFGTNFLVYLLLLLYFILFFTFHFQLKIQHKFWVFLQKCYCIHFSENENSQKVYLFFVFKLTFWILKMKTEYK